MRFLLAFENPWCLFSLLLLICLLLIAAALLSYSRSRERPRLQPAAPSRPLPATRQPEIAATAPFEALLAIQERLADMQRHLTPGSADARWLEGFRNDLRNVLDDVYWELYHSHGSTRTALLERLDLEVARLNQTIGAHISATISSEMDRAALHTQLDRLRDAVDEA